MSKTLKREELEELADLLDVQSPHDVREHLSKLTYTDLCWLAMVLRAQLDSKEDDALYAKQEERDE